MFGSALVKARRVFKMESPFEVSVERRLCNGCGFEKLCGLERNLS